MSLEATVVIIGASYSGIEVAHAILKEIPATKVILINPSRKLYFNVAAPRILAKPAAIAPEKYFLPIEKEFERYSSSLFEFVHGTTTSIDKEAKTVAVEANGSRAIAYDYLVIASGSTSPATVGQSGILAPFKPTELDDTDAAIKKAQDTIARAKSIVIGGAGPVGVEFAGEVIEASPEKSITLVSATEQLLPALKPAAGAAAEQILQSKGVKILAPRKVEKAEHDATTNKWVITLDGDEVIEADIYLSTTGVIPNNKFVPPEFLTSDGWVKVDDEFRVQSSKNSDNQKSSLLPIYAIGDITSHSPRLLSRVSGQTPILVGNLKADISMGGKRLKYNSDSSLLVLVPVGKTTGTGQLYGRVPWGFVVGFLKSWDFFISRAPSAVAPK